MRDDVEALEAALRSLAERLDLPAAPPIATTVAARLRADRVRAHRPPFAGVATWPRGRIVAAAAIGFLLLATAAVAGRLAIGPVSVEIVPSLAPSARPEAPGTFGEEVTVREAAAATGITPAWPPSLGSPDDAYVIRPPAPAAVLVLAWREGAGARIPNTPWTTVLFELRGDEEIAVKSVAASVYHSARVGGRHAVWISGAHDLSLSALFGGEAVRISGNVLIWERAPGLVYRLETMLSKAAAVDLAETLP